MKEEIIYFEINDWIAGINYPNCEPFKTWIRNELKFLENEYFVRDNKICVCEVLIDMSTSFLVTAPRKWVEEVCPALLLEENKRFISMDKKPKYGQGYYLPYDEEHIGKIEFCDEEDND